MAIKSLIDRFSMEAKHVHPVIVHVSRDIAVPTRRVLSPSERGMMEQLAPLYLALLAHVEDADFVLGEKDLGWQPVLCEGFWVSVLDANPYRAAYHARYILSTRPICEEVFVTDGPHYETFDFAEVPGTALTHWIKSAGGNA